MNFSLLTIYRFYDQEMLLKVVVMVQMSVMFFHRAGLQLWAESPFSISPVCDQSTVFKTITLNISPPDLQLTSFSVRLPSSLVISSVFSLIVFSLF